jgi:hypothetical protein
MKFCQSHWDKLRAAIEARGLTEFVSKGGEAAAELVKRQLMEAQEPLPAGGRATFDPLMNAMFAIVNNAMESTPAGLQIMLPNEDGSDRCPLCYINGERHKAAQSDPAGAERWARADDVAFYDEWVDRAADEQLARAKELGLVGGA